MYVTASYEKPNQDSVNELYFMTSQSHDKISVLNASQRSQVTEFY